MTVFGRQLLVGRVEAGWPATHASEQLGISRATAYKWVGRCRAEGPSGLDDRSFRPRRSRRRLSPDVEGTDTVTVNDMTGTDLAHVDVDLATALGGSTGDGLADTVIVTGTKGDDSIAVDANGAAVDVNGLAALVRITHADPTSDTLIVEPITGADNVVLDPAVNALILFSVL